MYLNKCLSYSLGRDAGANINGMVRDPSLGAAITCMSARFPSPVGLDERWDSAPFPADGPRPGQIVTMVPGGFPALRHHQRTELSPGGQPGPGQIIAP